jgi:uncharacterized membrane protein
VQTTSALAEVKSNVGENMKKILLSIMIFPLLFLSGCSKEMAGGAAVGVGAAGAAYEYQNKRTMDALEEDFKAGRITEDEYNRRKEEVKSRSLVY